MNIKSSSQFLPTHQDYMQLALNLAAERRGFCAPNPAVGAVIVKNGQVIARGSHFACGEPHAEVMAIREAGEEAKDSILYITLEPCCHFGKTPPCTDLIIKNKIKEVYYGMQDPNPIVAGKSKTLLQAVGIACHWLSSIEVEKFYRSYRYWWQQQQPWVTVKLALSLDGKIAAANGKPIALTGDECQQLTHQWRLHSDAILTTANTVIQDDPQLNVRLRDEIIKKPVYVIDRELRMPTDIQLRHTSQPLTIFHQLTADMLRQREWQKLRVRTVPIAINENENGNNKESENKSGNENESGEKDKSKRLDLQAILKFIGEDGIHDLWVEAGGCLTESLMQKQMAQRILFYTAPKVLGNDGLTAFKKSYLFDLANGSLSWQSLGNDMVMQWETMKFT